MTISTAVKKRMSINCVQKQKQYIKLSLSKQQALKCVKKFESFYYPLFGKKISY